MRRGNDTTPAETFLVPLDASVRDVQLVQLPAAAGSVPAPAALETILKSVLRRDEAAAEVADRSMCRHAGRPIRSPAGRRISDILGDLAGRSRRRRIRGRQRRRFRTSRVRRTGVRHDHRHRRHDNRRGRVERHGRGPFVGTVNTNDGPVHFSGRGLLRPVLLPLLRRRRCRPISDKQQRQQTAARDEKITKPRHGHHHAGDLRGAPTSIDRGRNNATSSDNGRHATRRQCCARHVVAA